MGTHFFKSGSSPTIGTGSSTNLQARALGAPLFLGRSAGAGATKDLGAAAAFNKLGLKKSTGSSAYAKGPKV